MINIEFIASEIRENRIEYARLKKELKQALIEQYNLEEKYVETTD